eukprot:TRINITY_DN1088_c0_g1_i2.p1 TRINITY_DN1088_c0_g1~~TRINITY_DN1088_c0_g1_i2.p1  ORF type:complete len:276 (+),score=95.60 TRINITY_DN1088_c0_g1_i2:31-858(+)
MCIRDRSTQSTGTKMALDRAKDAEDRIKIQLETLRKREEMIEEVNRDMGRHKAEVKKFEEKMKGLELQLERAESRAKKSEERALTTEAIATRAIECVERATWLEKNSGPGSRIGSRIKRDSDTGGAASGEGASEQELRDQLMLAEEKVKKAEEKIKRLEEKNKMLRELTLEKDEQLSSVNAMITDLKNTALKSKNPLGQRIATGTSQILETTVGGSASSGGAGGSAGGSAGGAAGVVRSVGATVRPTPSGVAPSLASAASRRAKTNDLLKQFENM